MSKGGVILSKKGHKVFSNIPVYSSKKSSNTELGCRNANARRGKGHCDGCTAPTCGQGLRPCKKIRAPRGSSIQRGYVEVMWGKNSFGGLRCGTPRFNGG